jgi:hypothetical protein
MVSTQSCANKLIDICFTQNATLGLSNSSAIFQGHIVPVAKLDDSLNVPLPAKLASDIKSFTAAFSESTPGAIAVLCY